jgi:hypothetical protein
MTLSSDFLLYCFVASMCIIAIHASTWNDMINEWVHKVKPFYKDKIQFDVTIKYVPLIERHLGIDLSDSVQKKPSGIKREWYMPTWISYPVFDCPICMSSVWGSSFSFLFHIESIQIPVFILAIAGFNSFFVVLKWIADK